MLILSTDSKVVVNLDSMRTIYIGANETSIKVSFADGSGCQIGTYQSLRECQIALDSIMESLDRNKSSMKMPSSEELRSKIIEHGRRDNPHHIKGKKTKGHGGS